MMKKNEAKQKNFDQYRTIRMLLAGILVVFILLACNIITQEFPFPLDPGPTNTPFPTLALSSSGKIAYSVLEPPGSVEGSHTWMVNGSSSNLANRWYWKIWMMDADGSNQIRVAHSEEDYYWSRDGKFLFYNVFSTSVHVFEVDTGLVQVFEADTSGQVPIFNIPDNISKPLSLWSPDGKYVTRWRGEGDDKDEIWLIDAINNDAVKLTNSQARAYLPRWSPDGSRIAYQTSTDHFVDVWVMNTDGSNPLKLSSFPDVSTYIAQGFKWSPDGTKIVFEMNTYLDINQRGIWVADADGSGMVQLTDNTYDALPQWSPDGSKIAYNSNGSIWIMDTNGRNKVRLTDNSLIGHFVSWSPDGRQIVFKSYSYNQIFRINVDGSDLVQLTDHEGGVTNPMWQPASIEVINNIQGENEPTKTEEKSQELGQSEVDQDNDSQGEKEPIKTVTLTPKTMSNTILVEDFNYPEEFTSTDPDIFIEDGKVHWTVYRDGGIQYIYREIQSFNGDFTLTVIGQINSASNNCYVKAGVGDEPGKGVEILFSWFGGGCPVQGYNIRTGGILLDIPAHECTTNWGEEQWPWITGGTEYVASVTITGNDGNLIIEEVGEYQGQLTYDGGFDTLYVGLTGGGDWPSCSGEIQLIEIGQ